MVIAMDMVMDMDMVMVVMDLVDIIMGKDLLITCLNTLLLEDQQMPVMVMVMDMAMDIAMGIAMDMDMVMGMVMDMEDMVDTIMENDQ